MHVADRRNGERLPKTWWPRSSSGASIHGHWLLEGSRRWKLAMATLLARDTRPPYVYDQCPCCWLYMCVGLCTVQTSGG